MSMSFIDNISPEKKSSSSENNPSPKIVSPKTDRKKSSNNSQFVYETPCQNAENLDPRENEINAAISATYQTDKDLSSKEETADKMKSQRIEDCSVQEILAEKVDQIEAELSKMSVQEDQIEAQISALEMSIQE